MIGFCMPVSNPINGWPDKRPLLFYSVRLTFTENRPQGFVKSGAKIKKLCNPKKKLSAETPILRD
jgi:hypothetical protein